MSLNIRREEVWQLELGEAPDPLLRIELRVAHAPARHHAVELAHEKVHERLDGRVPLQRTVLHRVVEEIRQVLEVVCVLAAAHLARRIGRVYHLAHPLAAQLHAATRHALHESLEVERQLLDDRALVLARLAVHVAEPLFAALEDDFLLALEIDVEGPLRHAAGARYVLDGHVGESLFLNERASRRVYPPARFLRYLLPLCHLKASCEVKDGGYYNISPTASQ